MALCAGVSDVRVPVNGSLEEAVRSCLVRVRGCTNIAEMSPGLWRLTPAGKISCRLPNNEGVLSRTPTPNQHTDTCLRKFA